MTTTDALARGRESFQLRAWRDAFVELSAVDSEAPLGIEDLERLAVAAHLVGNYDDCADAWERAHHENLRLGDAVHAARCAFWLAFGLFSRGEAARGGGWMARAQRLLDEGNHDCVERGYLLMAGGVQTIAAGDPAAAHAMFDQVSQIGVRFRDPDLLTMGRLGRGRALIHLGRTAEGVALLDEVMVAVTTGEISPIVVGDIYCAVIEGCQDIFDVRRAQAWTAALSQWCASQPDLVPYRGQCLVHRAELLQLHGAWQDAMAEVQEACERLSGHPAVGTAYYQQAELYRLRGEFSKAEEAYRQASRRGREPQPGLAQLRLAQGRVAAAEAAIRRVVNEAPARVVRSRLLAAFVEIVLAANDVTSARAAADELSEIAAELDAPFLKAMAAQATGAVLLGEGEARAACDALRRAWSVWQQLEAPYEVARVRVLIGLAYRELGDEDTADLELDAARWAYQQLGAAPDLARVEQIARALVPKAVGGLTEREVQVLALVAAGKTNRAIAAELTISEHTVARHLQNIFAKLNVSSRTAASAFAFEHQIV